MPLRGFGKIGSWAEHGKNLKIKYMDFLLKNQIQNIIFIGVLKLIYIKLCLEKLKYEIV